MNLSRVFEARRRQLVIPVVVAIALAAAGAGAASALATAGWSIEPTPAVNGPSQGVLWGDSCSSANACTGVGDYIDPAGTSVAVADRWDGVAWTSQATPSVPGGGVLYDASCVSATSCVAVGWSYGGASGAKQVLGERWDGAKWLVEQTPVPGGATTSLLAGVSCASAGSCTAVGYYVNGSGTQQPLAEVWNGSVWAIRPTAIPSGGGALSRVSCSSGSACLAIGPGSGGPLVEQWNGAVWSIQTIATPAGASSVSLYGVSCTGSTGCIVVGTWTEIVTVTCNPLQCHCFRPPCRRSSAVQSTLVEQWNGRSWTIQPTTTGTGGSLYNASCVGTACTAVGQTAGHGTLVEEWNGSTWTIQPTPAGGGGFSGVSCPTAGACEAVGAINGVIMFAEGWNGTSWAIQTTPGPPGPADNDLTGVSCPAATACTAVGSYTNISDQTAALADDWNGSTWASEPIPIPSSATSSSLARVSCTSPTACVAVGNYVNSAGTQAALAETWNGTAWAIQTTPNPAGASSSSLGDVSCTSSATCTAVGNYVDSSGTEDTLAEAWNGTTWTIQSTPDPPGAGGDALAGVSCTSSSACTAVGYAGVNADDQATLAETWNGTTWTTQTTASPNGETDSNLLAISCASASSCTAVGGEANFSTSVTYGMLAEHFDGSTWTVEPTPPPSGAPGSSLFGVSCTTDTACVAVGYYNDNEYPEVTGDTPIAESWNGTTWSTQLPPTVPGATISGLFGVSCTNSTACTAVGNSQTAGREAALAEGYTG
jgi:hypothetical protein